MKNRPGYLVIQFNHSGIPDKDLKPELFSPEQERILSKLDAHIQAEIRKGHPVVVIDSESSQEIAKFNIGNVNPSQFDIDMLARSLLPKIKEFYADPENVRKAEKWKKEQEKKRSNRM